MYAALAGRRYSLDVITRVTGEIERSADDPGTLDWDIVREGRVLYFSNGQTEVISASRGRPSPQEPPEPPASVQRWVVRAKDELELARFLLSSAGTGRSYAFSASNQQRNPSRR